MATKEKWLSFIITAVVIALCLLYGFWILTPTKISGNQEKKQAYEKTLEHLEQIAVQAHPSGSAAIEDVRRYLEGQFAELELPYEALEFQLNQNKYTNYLICLDAPDTDEGIMFVSHYDSVNTGPGACDDGIAVASMLTVLQEIKLRQEFTNDIYFLFTDGEERGLLGAGDFVNRYHEKYVNKVKLVVNVEARGNQGAVLMFETSAKDYQIARMLQRAVKSGSTPFSFATAIYERMPNDTDLTRFLEKGYLGMNFSVVDGGESYHQKTDDVEHLDKNTAYMYYSTVSELADFLEEYDTEKLISEQDGVYFPIARGSFAVFKEGFMNLLAIIVMAAFVCLFILLLIKKKVRIRRLLCAAGAMAATGVIAVGLVWLSSSVFKGYYDSLQNNIAKAEAREALFVIQLCGLTAAILILFHMLRKYIGNLAEHILLYGFLFFVICIALFIIFRPVVYLFALPLLLITIIGSLELLPADFPVYIVQKAAAAGLCLVMSFLFIPAIGTVYQCILFVLDIQLTGTILCVAEIIICNTCIGALLFSEKKDYFLQKCI